MSEEQTHLKLSLPSDDVQSTNSVISLSSSDIGEDSCTVPDVDFAPGPSNRASLDSPRSNCEHQPLLGRMDFDTSYNHFPGKIYSLKINSFIMNTEFH